MTAARTRTGGLVALALLLGVVEAWLAPTVASDALDSDVSADGFVLVDVPATAGAKQLWVDLEAPGLAVVDVVLRRAGEEIPLRHTPFGVGVVLSHDGSAIELELGALREVSVDLALTIADGQGRVLASDAAKLSLRVVQGGSTPVATPPPTGAVPPPVGTPTASSVPSHSPTPRPPRPGLPNTGADGGAES